MTHLRLPAAVAVLSLALAQQVFAQYPVLHKRPDDPQSDTYTIKVQSRIVVLDVVVTDKHGALVDNLTKDDFEVLENKEPQGIRTLEHTQPPPPSATPLAIHSTAELDRVAPNAPVSIIVLDEMNTEFQDEEFARYSLKRYLNTQGDTLSQPAMLAAVDLNHFMVLRDYTTSKQELLSALEHHLAAFPWHLQNGGWKNERFNAAFASLMEVAEATAGHPGHKNVVWIGRGFPGINMDTLSGDEEAGLKTEIQTCTNLLRDARVTLYTIDPAGLSMMPTPIDQNGFETDPFNGQVSFNDMARATGGRVFRNRNDVDAMIGTSVRDGSNFYTLSYMPGPVAEDDKPFRSVRVVMKDKNLRATTRAGYYSPPTTAASAPPAFPAGPTTAVLRPSRRAIFDLSIAGASTMVYDGIPFSLTRDTAAPDRFQLHVKPTAIPWEPGAEEKLTVDFVLYVESFDRKGKMLHRTANTLTLERPGSADAEKEISLSTTIPTAAPAARLRFVLRLDSNGKLGAENFYLVDPATLADPATGRNKKSKQQ